MKINANEIKMGNVLDHKDRLYQVIKDPEHTMPGKGGAFIQLELRNLQDHSKLPLRLRSNETITKAFLDEQNYSYLYNENNFVVLMHMETYEQINIPKELFANKLELLTDGLALKVFFYQESPVKITLPDTINVKVVETEVYIKKQTATGSFKPAITDLGFKIMVPQFITEGEILIIRTEDKSYVERKKS